MASEPLAELRAAAASVYYLCDNAAHTERCDHVRSWQWMPSRMHEPSSLPPVCCRQSVDVPDEWWVGFNKALRCNTEPFLLQFCDRRIVHRSNWLLGDSYGEHNCFAPRTQMALQTSV